MDTNLIFANLMAFPDCITGQELHGVNLSIFSDNQLNQLLSKSVGYAEDLIIFEFESRGDE